MESPCVSFGPFIARYVPPLVQQETVPVAGHHLAPGHRTEKGRSRHLLARASSAYRVDSRRSWWAVAVEPIPESHRRRAEMQCSAVRPHYRKTAASFMAVACDAPEKEDPWRRARWQSARIHSADPTMWTTSSHANLGTPLVEISTLSTVDPL